MEVSSQNLCLIKYRGTWFVSHNEFVSFCGIHGSLPIITLFNIKTKESYLLQNRFKNRVININNSDLSISKIIMTTKIMVEAKTTP